MNENKKIYIVIALSLGLLLFVYFVGRKLGKVKQQSKQGQDTPLPDSGSGIPAGWSPNGLVGRLHSAMDGLNVSWLWGNSERDDAFNTLASLTKDQVVAVYNQFNKLYGKAEDGQYTETLYNWIDGEVPGTDAKVRALYALESAGCR